MAACHHRGALGPNGSADGSAGTAGSTTGTGGSGGAVAGSGGGVAGGGPSGAGGSVGVGGSAGVVAGDPGFVGMRRLSDVEYASSLQAVLGLTGEGPVITAALAASAEPAPSFTARWTVDDFDTLSGKQGIASARFAAYFDAATAEIDSVFASDTLRPRLLTCAPASSTDETCARAIITAFGLRAWRRPLTAAEIDSFAALAGAARAAGGDFTESMRQVVLAMLVSESFLYRIEFDVPVTGVAAHALTPYEVASRLSFFLWGTTPDDQLLQLAAKGTLLNKDEVSAQAKRMLEDPRATAFVTNFFGQWLGFRALTGPRLDHPTPEWTATLQASMAAEAVTYVSTLIHEDRGLHDLFTTDVNFVDARLATVYGFAAPPLSAGLTRVVETADARKGYLGLGAFLASTSHSSSTSATPRGQWVLEHALCQPVPPPPGNHVPTLTGNAHEQFDALSTMPSCFACHSLMDRVGLGLEKFDEIGRFRASYGPGNVPIDDSGTLSPGAPFIGLLGLADLLGKDDRVSDCGSRAALSYAVGRPFDSNDARVAALAAQWRGRSIKSLVDAIVTDDRFRFRRGEGQP
jgi:Protein of unknown function (DUF1592)/Protein of unknown function (DUF1588)/Protein of unknown function (DUF1595)/Protein of unknown function (DUF1585)